MAVASIGNPMPILKRSIHGPGFGSFFSHAGNQQRTTYGAARPRPTVKKTARMIGVEDANANPSAAPRNGAVQGVARIVARTPLKNAPEAPSREASPLAPSRARPLIVTSNTPKRFSATSVTRARKSVV